MLKLNIESWEKGPWDGVIVVIDGNILDLAYYFYAAIGTRMAVCIQTWALCLLPLTSVMCRMDVLKYWNEILYP